MKPRLEAWLSSLGTRLAASFFAVALLVLVPSLVWFYSAAEKLTEERVEDLLRSVLVHDAALLASSIETRDFWQLYRLTSAMAGPTHVLNVAVLDNQGRLLAHSDASYYNQKPFGPTQRQAYEQVALEGIRGVVGYVLVERDKQGLKSYFLPLKKGFLVITSVLFGLAALLGVLLAYVWRRHLEKEQSLAFLGELATELAHEIRNDLAPVRLLCELGEFTQDDKKIMQQGLTHADRLLETFMTFAKSGQRKDELVELESCLALLLGGLEPLVKEKAIEFETSLDPSLAKALVPQSAFGLVVINLVRNAMQAVEIGGWVKLNLAKGSKGLRIEISDNGAGISPVLVERIFEPFLTQKKGGTGLGLVLVQRHLKEIGGELSLSSVEGKGTIFTVQWPLG